MLCFSPTARSQAPPLLHTLPVCSPQAANPTCVFTISSYPTFTSAASTWLSTTTCGRRASGEAGGAAEMSVRSASQARAGTRPWATPLAARGAHLHARLHARRLDWLAAVKGLRLTRLRSSHQAAEPSSSSSGSSGSKAQAARPGPRLLRHVLRLGVKHLVQQLDGRLVVKLLHREGWISWAGSETINPASRELEHAGFRRSTWAGWLGTWEPGGRPAATAPQPLLGHAPRQAAGACLAVL